MMPLNSWLLPILFVLVAVVSGSDLGLNAGSKAASQLASHGLHSALQNPRRLNIELLTAQNPWFDPIAHVNTHARVLVRDLSVRFHDDLVDVRMTNLSVSSDSNIVLPLPFFLGEDNVKVDAQVPYAEIQLKADQMKLTLDTCDIATPDVHFKLERSPLMNYVLKPFVQLPISLVEDLVCSSISDPLNALRNKFEMSVPLIYMLPAKFRPYLIQKNTTLVLQLQSIQSKDEQLTLVAGIEWKETNFDAPSDAKTLTMADMNGADDPDNLLAEPVKYTEEELASRRLELWVEDRLFNELMEKFDWNFEWLVERVPVDSPKLPQSTREFLGVLCSDCYFELKVSSSGIPHLETRNKTLVLTMRNQIFLKVVNPSLSKNSVFISFYLTLTVQLIPKVENGIFRTQINLLNTSIEMEKGAFPSAWNIFVQDLVRDMIMNVIWVEFKNKIEVLTYSDGLLIPKSCGTEPTSIQMYIDDSRFGVSGSLVLEEFSPKQCFRNLKSSLPDPSNLFDIKHHF